MMLQCVILKWGVASAATIEGAAFNQLNTVFSISVRLYVTKQGEWLAIPSSPLDQPLDFIYQPYLL